MVQAGKIDTSNTHIQDCSLPGLIQALQLKKSGGVKLVLWALNVLLSKMIWYTHSSVFQNVSKMTTHAVTEGTALLYRMLSPNFVIVHYMSKHSVRRIPKINFKVFRSKCTKLPNWSHGR